MKHTTLALQTAAAAVGARPMCSGVDFTAGYPQWNASVEMTVGTHVLADAISTAKRRSARHLGRSLT